MNRKRLTDEFNIHSPKEFMYFIPFGSLEGAPEIMIQGNLI